MNQINLQHKTKAQNGTIEVYWFENEFVGLENTRFHRITVPLSGFDSGLDYESQPVETEIVFDWLKLPITDPYDLGNLEISSQQYDTLEASVYIGGAHNWCEVEKLIIKKQEGNQYSIESDLLVDFEAEGVAQNERFCFETTIAFIPF